MAFKIIADAVAVPRAITVYEDDEGNTKYLHISKVYVKDEVVQDENVSPLIHQLYADGDEGTRATYKKVSDDHFVEKAPLEGYDELDELGVRARMVNLPSEDIEAIKRYERDHQNRTAIVEFITGYGESTVDRVENKLDVQSEYQPSSLPDDQKAKEVITPGNKKVRATTSKPKAQPKPAAKRTSAKKTQPKSEE